MKADTRPSSSGVGGATRSGSGARRSPWASSSGTPVTSIARLVAADEDTVRDVVHAFNDKGLAALDPRWAGGRPRLVTDDDIAFIVTTSTTRPTKLGCPFTHGSLRKLVQYLGRRPQRRVVIGRERLRQTLRAEHVSFQRTRTGKESTDPDKGMNEKGVERMLARSSLGTRAASEAQARVAHDRAAAIVARAARRPTAVRPHNVGGNRGSSTTPSVSTRSHRGTARHDTTR